MVFEGNQEYWVAKTQKKLTLNIFLLCVFVFFALFY